MKKFLVICLSVVMLFSTLLLCGFASPEVLAENEQWEIVEVDGVEYYKKPVPQEGFLSTVYFDLSNVNEFGSAIYSVIGSSTTYYISYYLENTSSRPFWINQTSSSTSGNGYIYSWDIKRYAGGDTLLTIQYNTTTSYTIITTNNLTDNKVVFNADLTSSSVLGSKNDLLLPYVYVLEEVPAPPPSFVGSLINGMGQVFTEYVPLLAVGILNMFTGIFWQNGAFTMLGYALVTLLGIALVSSIFYVVYRIFKGKIKKRL